ncbi:MAG: septum formation family protein [Pseudonocardiales bacterium]|nr:septum formation family protein [Pseudonocardiales bacterium]MBV9028874.1 septum formation family protein [Pseudonocardiales bacterium]MBW0010131.1 septum formation family protein [Pseudonocardiales bacterium]
MAPPDTPVSPDGHRAGRSARWLAVGAVLGALVALVAVGVPTGKAPLLAVGPSTATTPSAQSLRAPAHTCLSWRKPDAVDADAVSCAQPHLFEVTGTLDLQDFGARAAFPDPARWQQLVTQRCTQLTIQALADHFDPFGRFTVGAIKPSEASWAQGDRTLRCGVQSAGRTGTLFLTTGSVLGQDQSDVHPPGTCLGNDGKALGDPVDCADAHAIEVVGVVDLKGAFPQGHPDEAAQDRVLNTECTRLAKDFAGGPAVVANKRLTLFWETLRTESWQAGSTRVDCRLGAFLPDRSGFAPVTGSVKGPVQVGRQPAPAAPREAGPAPVATPPVTQVDVPAASPP